MSRGLERAGRYFRALKAAAGGEGGGGGLCFVLCHPKLCVHLAGFESGWVYLFCRGASPFFIEPASGRDPPAASPAS